MSEADEPKCPHCGSSAGYVEKTICRMTRWCSFNGEGHDAEVEVISGGLKLKCADCKRDVSKYAASIKARAA